MIISVFGPTGSGKSDLAIKLAKDLNGEIVNCDSVQVYKEFRVGAAQPEEHQKKLVPHHFYEVIDPVEPMSVGKYLKLIVPCISNIKDRDKQPVLVGGTALYLTALIYGIADLPQDSGMRAELDQLSNEQILSELGQLNPQSAKRIHANDRGRLLRALETSRLGVNIDDAYADHQKNLEPKNFLIIVPVWERQKLYERINHRTEKMFAQGLVEETKYLMEKYPDCEALSSIGYNEVVDWIVNPEKMQLGEVKKLVAQKTRRFAKRQLTWLRNEPIKKGWISRPDASLQIKSTKIKDLECLDWDYSTLRQEAQTLLKSAKKGVFIWFVSADKVV